MLVFIYRQEIRLWDSIGFLSLYLVYILVVIFGRIIHQYMRKRALQVQQEDQEQIISNEVQPAIEDQKEPDQDSIQETEPEYVSWVQPGSISGSSDQMDSVSVQMPNGPWSRLIHFLNPFKEWSQKNCLGKFWLIIKSPVILILNMTIPVVDQDQDQKGWCQYLHAFQLSLSGFMICLFTKEMSLEILDIKFWQLALIISLLVTILLLMTSSNSNPPKLQPLLAYFGFVISVGWIYLIANEIVSILKALGVYFGLSDAILGLTVLAWGNSIGDLVADVSMAKQGSPRMGFSACFGGPLFNLLLGIGLPFTISLATTDSNVLPVQYDQMILILCAGLGVALVTNLFLFPFTKFKGTKIHGLILVVLYIAFMTVAIYFEFKYEE